MHEIPTELSCVNFYVWLESCGSFSCVDILEWSEAADCNTLQRTATYYNEIVWIFQGDESVAVCCSRSMCGLSNINTRLNHKTLQHTATHCNTLQYTVIHCNTLQHAETRVNIPGRWELSTQQNTATHCNTLQHIATHSNTRETQSDESQAHDCWVYRTDSKKSARCSNCVYWMSIVLGFWRTLQHAATRCNTLQHTATHCNTCGCRAHSTDS